MVLRLTDPVGLAEPAARSGGPAVLDEIVRLVQQAAEEANLAYLRIMGDVVIAADGFGDRSEAAASAIPRFALEVTERCAGLFAALDRGNAFQIGIDLGTVSGSGVGVGRGGRVFNIWGEAVRGAETMAASAPAGGVQVTEAVRPGLARPSCSVRAGASGCPAPGSGQPFF